MRTQVYIFWTVLAQIPLSYTESQGSQHIPRLNLNDYMSYRSIELLGEWRKLFTPSSRTLDHPSSQPVSLVPGAFPGSPHPSGYSWEKTLADIFGELLYISGVFNICSI